MAALTPTIGSLGLLGFGVSAPAFYLYDYLHNNVLLDSGGFTALNTGGPGAPTLDANGLPTVPATLVFVTQSASGLSNVPPGNYWLNVPSVGQTVTASVSSAGAPGAIVLGTGVAQGDGVTIRYPVQIVSGVVGAGAVNFSGNMSAYPSLARNGATSMAGLPVFADVPLAHYSQQSCLRLMDFLYTNGAGGEGRADTTWSTAPPDWALSAYAKPNSWQKFVLFVNACVAYPGSKVKNVFLNIPPYCDDTYVSTLASLLTSLGLSSSINLHIQRANEQWNSAFICWATYRINALTELSYLDNYSGSGSVLQISSVTSDGTKLTFTTTTPITSSPAGAFLTTTAPCVVVGNVGGFNIGTFASPVTATKTGASTFTIPSTGTAGSGQFGVIFNLASTLIADGVLPDAYHAGGKWYTRRLYQDYQLWHAVRPQDRFYLDTQLYGGEGPGGNTSSQIEYAYAAYLGGGVASSWLYGAAVGFYATPTSGPSTVDALVTQLTTTINTTMDGYARGHSYQCRKLRIKPMAYEGGFEQGEQSGLVDAFMTDPRAGTVLTALLDKWHSNGCENFVYFNGSPAADLTYAALKTYADTTSPKYVALLAYKNKAINYANVHGSGASGTLDLVGYYQAADSRIATFNGLLGWYDTPPNYVDVDLPVDIAGSYTLTVKGAAGLASTIQLFVDPTVSGNGTSIGTSTVRAANSGWFTAGPGDALPVLDPVTVTLTAGIHTIRLTNPQRTGGGGIGLLNVLWQRN
jgi:hypothetical protein